MEQGRSPNFVVVWVYTLVSAGLLWFPLLNTLHAEASAVIATLAFFAAGLDAIRLFRLGERRVRVVLVRNWLYLLAPFAVYQLARLWLPSCDFWEGAWFYVLFTLPSVLLAVSLAFLLTGLGRGPERVSLFVVGILLMTLPVLYDLGLHPQFYVYNHVFGGVLGPLYEFELASRSGMYWFRLLTVIWSGVAILIGHQLREPSRGAIPGAIVLAILIAFIYGFSGRLGINTTYGQLSHALGSTKETEHFVIHYDSSDISESEIARLAEDHEFRYDQLERRLGFESALPVHSYLYPSPQDRGCLTGAGRTSVAPVWLTRPQLHVLDDSYQWSFAHELAHVFSREMGLPVLRSSLHVGLVEGFAVAMEPPMGLPSPDAQVAAILETAVDRGIYETSSVASAVAASLSPHGFWTGRGAVSYTTMGSFVGFLIDRYGLESFSRVYAMETFRAVYGRSVLDLAREWEASLRQLEPDPATYQLAAARFSVLSLFERECPHDVPDAVQSLRDGQRAIEDGDSTAALRMFEGALALEPGLAEAMDPWAQLKLAAGKHQEVVVRLGSFLNDEAGMQNPVLAMHLGDALALSGKTVAAREVYQFGIQSASPYSRSLRAILQLRSFVADRPDIVSAIHSPQEAIEKAMLISSVEDSTGAGLILAALLVSEAEHDEMAETLLAAAAGTVGASTVRERFFSWRAAFALRSRRFDDAERFRARAEQEAVRLGDTYQVHRLRDFESRIEWTKGRDRP